MTAGTDTHSNGTPTNGDGCIDMRSDTVTRPTAAMLQAAACARVDDDVLGNDPTTLELENFVATLLGKDAGLFLPSGTMANLCAVLTHCPMRGSEFIVGDCAHIYVYEQGGSSTLGGVHPRVVPNAPDGSLPLHLVESAIRPSDDHFPVSRLVCIENTQNKCGGRVLSVDYVEELSKLCKERSLKLHCDGARLMHAAAALKCAPSELVKGCDSVSLCLSKALGAPLGSVLVGEKDFIRQCRRTRKALGGGMRQSGVVAAMGLVAIRDMAPGLERDNEKAKRFADAIQKIDGIKLDIEGVQSNIVYFNVALDANVVISDLKKSGVLMLPTGKNSIRACMHHQVGDDAVQSAINALANTMAERSTIIT